MPQKSFCARRSARSDPRALGDWTTQAYMTNAAHSLLPDTPVLRFAGHNFEPLPSGALYWHARETLLVADLHFEKMASFARRGQ